MVYQGSVGGSLIEIESHKELIELATKYKCEFAEDLKIEIVENIWYCMCRWFHTDVRDEIQYDCASSW